MDPLIFILAIPFGILIGLGAGVIGLSAWPLVVPLLLVFGGLPLHEVLLSSLLIDLAITIVLSLFYVNNQDVEVDTTYGTQLGVFAGIIAITIAIIVFPMLEQLSGFFEGGSSIVTLVLGGLFIVQAIRMVDTPATTDERSENKPIQITARKKNIITIGICVIQGILTGIIAMSGAMNIVIVLMFLLGYPTLRAVGTAMIATAVMLVMMVVTYLILLQFTLTALPIIALFILIASVSSYLSVTKAQNIPERKLRFTIGIVVLTAAIFATVQVYFLG
ncbi:MAG: sulfite exporter TauE/SafE family protein [Candidatus Thorarchaeota archaeon]